MKLDKTLIITSSLYSRKMMSQIKAFGIIMVNHLLMSGKGLVWNCLEIKRKKKDKRSEEFDASCYFSGCLIVNKRTSLLLSEKLKGQIEVLPVNVDGNASGYYFINVLNTVDALNIESKSNEEILKMMRDNNGIFNKGNIGSYIIFSG